MSRWLLVALLALQVHFAASYLVPLDDKSQREFGGLLPWFWPWAYGDGGLLGQITVGAGFPMVGFYVAMTAATILALAALAVAGVWIPTEWWRSLALAGALFLAGLMVLFFGPTKLLPLAVAMLTAYLAVVRPGVFDTA